MSEYLLVEKPLLNQLKSMGWDVTDLGQGVPTDPTTSFRSSFREVILKDIFKAAVHRINTTDDGKPWLTDSQLDVLLDDVTDFGTHKLLAANEEFIGRLHKWQIDRNELTGEEDPVVKLIDFDNWENNTFTAINQFRVDTPGLGKEHIRPDIALFVNGLPLVVIECKEQSQHCCNPMAAGIDQLRRYADLREPEHSKLREGEPALFFTNQLMISTYGDDCKVGTITSNEDYYFNWKTIHPDTEPYIAPEIGTHRSQEKLVQGMLHPQRLLDITCCFTLFMDTDNGPRIKVICRYQQFRAVQKIIERMEQGETGIQRSGVVWHTQGSGKSLTMVFLVRKLRRHPELKSYKVLMVNDRSDLEEQLTNTAALIGDTVIEIKSTKDAKEKLANDTSNTNMVMVHKFREQDSSFLPESVRKLLSKHLAEAKEAGDVERIEELEADFDAEIVMHRPFGVINAGEKVLILVDEAHRTQRGGKDRPSLSDNLFDAFPKSTRVAFTGTPLIADHHTYPTWKRFGVSQEKAYIDKYKLQDAVDDGATLKILYEGKTADSAIYDKAGFDTKFEDLFADRTEEELREIRKKYGAEGDILEAEKRIEEIAEDLVKHYIRQILPAGFKAQVVCSSKQAAVHYQTYIEKALAKEIERYKKQPEQCIDKAWLERLEFLKTAVVISSDDNNEAASFTYARKQAKELKAVESFKKKFDHSKPNTGVAFLIVCDMLLTGFDAPIEQVMYLDKKLREHNLLQTIARVNRTAKEKQRGYIVDYIGLAHHLRDALSMYSQDDQDDILKGLQNIDSEVPVLESRYRRLLQLFTDLKVYNIEAFVNQKLNVDEHYQVQLQAIAVLEDPRQRDSFNVFLKKFLQSMDIIMPNSLADPYKTPMYQFVHIQAKARQRYQDDSMSFQGVGAKIRHLVNEHLISLGINPKIKPIDLFSDAFMAHMGKEADLQAQASEMEHAIRKHCKVNADDDPVFYKRMSEKLDEIIKKHAGNWDKLILAQSALRDEIDAGRGPNAKIADPFFDLIVSIAFPNGEPVKPMDKVKACVDAIMDELGENIGSLDFWERDDLISELEGKVEMRFLLSGVPQLSELSEQLTTEVVALARRRELLILSEQALNERIDEIIEMLRAIAPEALQKQISKQPDLSLLKYDLDGVDLFLAQELEQYESFYELALIKVATDIHYVEDAEHHSSLPYEVRKQFLLNAEDVREALADIILSIQSELTFPDFEHKPIVALKETAKGSLFITVVVGVMTNFIYDVIKTTALKGRQPIKDIVSKGGRVKSELPALVERNRAERGLNESNYRISYTEERNLVDDALKQLRDRNLPNPDKNKHH
ncbi:type I restriction endonuclease subunit R [Shewanella algae]|uniref:type I restriction endonuclease subunit R n=1 Tax=Shewanella algae TaxID=38313 RepID=UPI000468321E|nr:HsdR family type I site-specific deoxyribonuclease [Shewanella algae]NKZ42181.1 type I restriction endonuclease subunit R [Shewanella algae]QTE79433.1 type I restriction endonuclease subunit R [Shewanella algae]